jgi:hypothetical protein
VNYCPFQVRGILNIALVAIILMLRFSPLRVPRCLRQIFTIKGPDVHKIILDCVAMDECILARPQ